MESNQSRSSVEERIAWYAVLALPVLVPVAVGIRPFSSAFAQNPFTYPKILALALLVAVGSVAWGVGVVRRTITPRSVPGGWWLVGFLGLAAVSTALALSPSMAFFGGKYARVGLMVMLLVAAAFFLAVQTLTSPARMRALAWSVLVVGVLAAVVLLLESRGIDPLNLSRENPVIFFRGPSLMGNPDFTGNYLVVSVVLSAALALSATAVRERIVAWASFAVTALAVVVSLTRGAWIGVAVGLGVLLIVAARSKGTRRDALLVVAGLAALLLVAVVLRGPATFTARFSDLKSSTTAGDSRFVLWGEALKVVKGHPLVGTGPDSYPLGWYAARSRTTMRLTGIDTVIDDPHNMFLLLLATLGIPAGLLGTALILAPVVVTARSAVGKDRPASRQLYTGWWAAGLGLVAAFVFAANVVVLTLMLAVISAVLLAPRSRRADGSPSMPWSIFAVVLPLAAAAALVISVISFSADVRLRSAQTNGSSAGTEAAAASAPWHAEAQYLAAYASSNDAAAALVQGLPGGQEAANRAELRLATFADDTPHEYASRALQAYFLSQVASIEGTATFQRARDAASAASRIYPLSPVTAYLKALAQANLGDLKGAVKTLEPVWNLDPRYTQAGVLYVQLLAETDRPRAMEALEGLKARYPGGADVAGVARALEASGTAK